MTEKIRQILQLKQVMRWWRSFSFLGRSPRSDTGSSRSVRPGYVAVYVGPDRRRFVIPTRFLNLPVFAKLLEKAEEEYGFQPAGGLALPCEPGFFDWLLDVLNRDENRFGSLGLEAFSELFASFSVEKSCRVESSASCVTGCSPLLHKAKA